MLAAPHAEDTQSTATDGRLIGDTPEVRSRHAMRLLCIGVTRLSFGWASLYLGPDVVEPAAPTGRADPAASGNHKGNPQAEGWHVTPGGTVFDRVRRGCFGRRWMKSAGRKDMTILAGPVSMTHADDWPHWLL